MILSVGDWIFDVDMAATMEYSAAEAAEHCTCHHCRNFYGTVDRVYPSLRPFLAGFGIDVEAPDQMTPSEAHGAWADYDPSYFVFGKILQMGQQEMSAGHASVFAAPMSETHNGQPYFRLDVYGVVLPWSLMDSCDDT